MRAQWLAFLLLGGCLVTDQRVDELLDRDGDGERARIVGGTDCDDDNPHVGRSATELCGNAVDDDCDGAVDDSGVGARRYWIDDDGDGHGDPDRATTVCSATDGLVDASDDCNDDDESVHPGAVEDCTNGVDDNCDQRVDEVDNPTQWWPDSDGDGWGTDGAAPRISCIPLANWSPSPGDCDDRDDRSYPGALP